MNAVKYKEIFPLIRDKMIWYRPSFSSGDREFRVPEHYPLTAAGSRIDEGGQRFVRVKGVRWFTNIEHGRRHQPLQLMTQSDNRRFGPKQIVESGYPRYANYDAIEVSVTIGIPLDYEGVMDVPIGLLDKNTT